MRTGRCRLKKFLGNVEFPLLQSTYMQREKTMKATGSFATTSFAGILLALMTAPGAAPSLAPIESELASGYHCAVRAYDRARMWSVLARWWIDPEYAPSVRSESSEDLCQVRSSGGRITERR
jgi:hypothetical protein